LFNHRRRGSVIEPSAESLAAGAALSAALLFAPALRGRTLAHPWPAIGMLPVPESDHASGRVTTHQMTAQSAPRRRLDPNECEVLVWRGYVRSRFYARCVGPDGSQIVIAESPAFRFRATDDGAPNDAVRSAHEDLLAELEAEGWEVVDSGTRWYRTRLRRRSDT